MRLRRYAESAAHDANRRTGEIWYDDDLTTELNAVTYEYDDADRLTMAEDDFATNTFSYLLDCNLASASNISNVGTPDMPEITLDYDYVTPNAIYLNNLRSVSDDWNGVTTYGFSENGRLDSAQLSSNLGTLAEATLKYTDQDWLAGAMPRGFAATHPH